MVQLQQGSVIRFSGSFNHVGNALSDVKARAAIGNKGTFGFDEVLYTEIALPSIPYHASQAVVNFSLEMIIPQIGGYGNPEPGSYDTYVKVSTSTQELFWYGPLDDVQLVSGSATISNLTVSYAKA
jgi:hypothetical protein